MGHVTPDNSEGKINDILLINYVGYRPYSLASYSRVVTPNAYQKYDWDQNYMSAETGYTGANHVQYYKYGLLHLSV